MGDHTVSGTTTQAPAVDGTKVIFVELARYDPEAAPPRTYVEAVCHLIDEAYRPEEPGKITIVCDVRGGEGWKNPKPMAVLGFGREIANTLPNFYPERLRRMVIYTAPWVATKVIVPLIRPMVDPNTYEKVVLVSGQDSPKCCPVDELRRYLSIGSIPAHALHRHPGWPTDRDSDASEDRSSANDSFRSARHPDSWKPQRTPESVDTEEFFSADEGDELLYPSPAGGMPAIVGQRCPAKQQSASPSNRTAPNASAPPGAAIIGPQSIGQQRSEIAYDEKAVLKSENGAKNERVPCNCCSRLFSIFRKKAVKPAVDSEPKV